MTVGSAFSATNVAKLLKVEVPLHGRATVVVASAPLQVKAALHSRATVVVTGAPLQDKAALHNRATVVVAGSPLQVKVPLHSRALKAHQGKNQSHIDPSSLFPTRIHDCFEQ